MIWLVVAFDILYVGDTSVIHQSLRERHELLRKVVKPIKGRLEILVPNGGLNDHRPSGKGSFAIYSSHPAECSKSFWFYLMCPKLFCLLCLVIIYFQLTCFLYIIEVVCR